MSSVRLFRIRDRSVRMLPAVYKESFRIGYSRLGLSPRCDMLVRAILNIEQTSDGSPARSTGEDISHVLRYGDVPYVFILVKVCSYVFEI